MKIQKPYGLMVGQVIFVFLWIYMAGKQMARLRGDFLAASKNLLGSFTSEDLRKDLYILKGYENNVVVNDFYRPIGKLAIENNSYVTRTEFALSFRLSEAYLILAEAVYKIDQDLSIKLINAAIQSVYKQHFNLLNCRLFVIIADFIPFLYLNPYIFTALQSYAIPEMPQPLSPRNKTMWTDC